MQIASEVFVNLLLSGAEDVGKSEATAGHIYQLLDALVNNLEETLTQILATRLFMHLSDAVNEVEDRGFYFEVDYFPIVNDLIASAECRRPTEEM